MNKLSQDVSRKLDDARSSESDTGRFLVEPFFIALEYEPREPSDVKSQLTADVGSNKNKADYVLQKDYEELILVEIKKVDEDLSKWQSQLDKYFRAKEDVRFGILSNGVEYRFYTDFNKQNVLDNDPFVTLNALQPDDQVVSILSAFCKTNFDLERALEAALELKHREGIRESIEREIQPLSDDLIKFFIKKSNFKANVTAKVFRRLSPIVRQAWNELVEGKTANSNRQSSSHKSQKPSAVARDRPESSEQTPIYVTGNEIRVPIYPKSTYTQYEGVSAELVVKRKYKKRNDKVVLYKGYEKSDYWAVSTLAKKITGGGSYNGWTSFWYYDDPFEGKRLPIDNFRHDKRLVDHFLNKQE